MIGVDCGLSDSTRSAIMSELASHVPDGAGEISLVPVLYTKGTAKVLALDYQSDDATAPAPPAPGGPGVIGGPMGPPPIGGPGGFGGPVVPPPIGGPAPSGNGTTQSKFVHGVVGSATPSLLQDQRAIFSLSLTPDAATLIEDAYEVDLSPIGVMYELEFSGLRPALSVHATVNRKRCYEFFKAGLHIGMGTGGGTQPAGGGTQPGGAPGGPGGPPVTPPGGPGLGGPGLGGPPVHPPGGPGLGGPGLGGPAHASAVGAHLPPGPGLGGPPPSSGGPQPPPTGTQPSPIVTQPPPTGGTQAPPTGAQPPPTGVVQPPPIVTQPPPIVTQPPPTGTQPPPGTQPPGGTTTNPSTQVAVDADLSYSMEKLRQEEAITIEIIQQQEGRSVDDMLKQAMDLLKGNLINDFFKPAMTATPASPAATGASLPSSDLLSGGRTGAGTRVAIGFVLQYKTEEELSTATYDFTAQMPQTLTHAPNGFFSALLRPTEKKDHIREIDLDDPFFKILEVQTSTIADYAAIDLKTIVVDVAYGGTVDEPRALKSHTFTPTDNAPKGFQAFLDGDEMSYRNRISYYFAQSEIGAQHTQYQTEWRGTISRALVVNPPDDIPMLHVYAEQGVIDWDLVSKVETRVVYDDAPNNFRAERTFLVGPDFKRQEWIVRLTNPKANTYKVQHTWFLKDDNRQIHGQEQVMSAAQLFIPDPFLQRLPIVIEPEVDPANVQRITIELHYTDSDNQLDLRKFVDIPGPAYKPITVSLPMMDPTKRTFGYQCTLIKATGSENRPEVQTDQPTIIVTEGGVPFDVDVRLLGDLAQSRLTGLEVDLRSEPLDSQQPKIESHLFEPGGDKHYTQRLLLRADRPAHYFEYKTTVFLPDKDPVEGDWTRHDSSILVLQASRLLESDS